MSTQTNPPDNTEGESPELQRTTSNSSLIDILKEKGHTPGTVPEFIPAKLATSHQSLKVPRPIVKTQRKSATEPSVSYGNSSEQHPNPEPASSNTELWQNGLRPHSRRTHRSDRKPRHSKWSDLQSDSSDTVSRIEHGRSDLHQSLEDTDPQEDSGYPGDGDSSSSTQLFGSRLDD